MHVVKDATYTNALIKNNTLVVRNPEEFLTSFDETLKRSTTSNVFSDLGMPEDSTGKMVKDLKGFREFLIKKQPKTGTFE